MHTQLGMHPLLVFLTHSLTHTLTLTHTHTLTLTHTHTHAHSHANTLTLKHTLSHTHTLTHTLSLTHTHREGRKNLRLAEEMVVKGKAAAIRPYEYVSAEDALQHIGKTRDRVEVYCSM